MYAIVSAGGHQVIVVEGGTLRLPGFEGEPGDEVHLGPVHFVGGGGEVLVGTPVVEGARVRAEVLGRGRGEKIVVSTYKRRKKARRKIGHRQDYTELLVRAIEVDGVD